MTPPRTDPRRFLATLAVGVAATGWAYGSTLAEVAERWASDPQYSHGFLVPAFSGYLLLSRRGLLAGADLRPRWWGVGIVLAGLGLRWLSFARFLPALDAVSLVVVLFGLVAVCGGRAGVRWAWSAVLFLSFMLPLPHTLQSRLGLRLQAVATACSTFVLQTIGIPAIAQGNTIFLSSQSIEVAAACSGLSMLMTFLALSAAMAILTSGWPRRAAVLLAAFPIAIAANVIRIAATGVFYEYNQGETARLVFHDGAGYLMMAIGLGMLLVLLHVLGRAVVPAGGRDRALGY